MNHLGVRQKYKDAMERETFFVEDVLDSELATSLLEYVEYIPDPEGKVMKLYLAGLDAEEIADHMKLSIRTVYNAKSRAVGMLKKVLFIGESIMFLKMKVFYVTLYLLFVLSLTAKAQDSVKVALVQAHLAWGDVDANLRDFDKRVRSCRDVT